MVCRICWGTEEEDSKKTDLGDNFNPLISPCKCAGTMGLIHLKCLRGWLETKRQRKIHGWSVIYKFKKLDCELCNTKFPFKVSYNNEIVDIVGVDKPDKNFIILESLSNESQKIFHVIDTTQLLPFNSGLVGPENKQLLIGRGQDSDVRVTDDISVSRKHAFIMKSPNGDYYLIDNKSKFGTLIQIQYPVFLSSRLLHKTPLVLQ